jgi:hypothetical protein
MRFLYLILAMLVSSNALAVTLPYTFGTSLPPSQVNSNFSALRDAHNNHAALSNAHSTSLADVLAIDPEIGSYFIDFSNSQLFSARIENLAEDPETCDSDSEGRLIWNTDSTELRVCNGSSWSTTSASADSDLAALEIRVDGTEVNITSMEATLASHTLSLTSHETDIAQLQTDVSTAQATADDHIADSAGAHAASAISNTPSGNLAATTVQAALDELQTAIDGFSGVSDGDKGDITVSSSGAAWAIDDSVVTNAKLADVANNTIKGNDSGSSAAPQDLTGTEVTALLDAFTGDSGSGGVKGLVPAPASGDAAADKFLKADGTWTAPTGSGDVVGPASSTDNAIARFDSTTGKLLQNSSATIDDSGNITATSFIGDLTGNADTATALAANPVDCGAGEFANAIAANGDLTCATPAGGSGSGKLAQVVSDLETASLTGTTTIPVDDSIPQQTEGNEFLSVTITPTNASSTLVIESTISFSSTGTGTGVIALFQDSTADAIAANVQWFPSANNSLIFTIRHTMTAGTTSATTFKIRAGINNAGTIRLNGQSGGRLMGGVGGSALTVTEVLP